jgi:hypothetical protein
MALDDEAQLERFLARAYADAGAAAAFAADPEGEARRAGLPAAVVARLAHVDRAGLALAARSFARKRQDKLRHARDPRWRRLWRRLVGQR